VPNNDVILLSCEHAGNEVPDEYKYLFNGHEDILETHRGYDPGALEETVLIATKLGAPYISYIFTRLLIEPNRYLGSPELFSEYSAGLSDDEKQKIISTYYLPFRHKLDEFVEKHTEAGESVLHISLHSCTDNLNGETRDMDFGILFDPERTKEKELAENIRSKLNNNYPDLVVAFNFPYLGTSDGTVEWLRRKYHEDNYTGLEIETNQRYILGAAKDPLRWNYITHALADGIYAGIKEKI
jgi:predicted N-formylglutamate amidohydrolase